MCLGMNNGGLKGCENDSKLAFNYFSKFNPKLLRNIKELKDNINIYHLEKEEYTIILTYAGHDSNILGNLNSLITNGAKRKFNILIILDCCHSGKIQKINSELINKQLIITACKSNQNSAESVSQLQGVNENGYNLIKNNNYHIGVFTYNFFNLLRRHRDLEKVIKDPIWKDIEFISKQTLCIFGNKELLLELL